MDTDEDALMDVLLCRLNVDVRAVPAEYKRVRGVSAGGDPAGRR